MMLLASSRANFRHSAVRASAVLQGAPTMKHLLFAACLFVGAAANAAPVLAPAAPLAAEFKQYVRVPGGRIALTHVRVIDGTGAAPVEDQTLLIDGARIAAVQAAPVT